MTVSKLQLKIGGMSCSFCTETIRKAYSRMDGVQAVHVSLSHEEALIEYDPAAHTSAELRETLRRARNLLLWAVLFTSLSLVLMLARWLGRPLPWGQPLMIGLALLTVFGAGRHILLMVTPDGSNVQISIADVG